MLKIFLDANIIIDLLDETRSNHEASKKIITQQHCKITISEDILTNTYYIMRRHLSHDLILDFFEFIRNDINISTFGDKVLAQSIQYTIKNNADLEDVLQAFCAHKNKVDFLITADLNFPKDIVPILSPEEFLNKTR